MPLSTALVIPESRWAGGIILPDSSVHPVTERNPMFDMLEKVARQSHMTKALAEGKILPPATISQIKAETLGILEPKNFAEGDAVKCVRKPWGLEFPEIGDVAIVVSQDGMNLIADNEPGSARSAADLGDTLVAFPKVSDTGWLIFQVPSGCFEKATEEEVAEADAKLVKDAEELVADAKAKVAARRED